MLWYSSVVWLLLESGALPVYGCSRPLARSFRMAALLKWRSAWGWLLLLNGALSTSGCSGCMALSRKMAAGLLN